MSKLFYFLLGCLSYTCNAAGTSRTIGIPSIITGSVDIPRYDNIDADDFIPNEKHSRFNIGSLAPSKLKPIFPGKWNLNIFYGF